MNTPTAIILADQLLDNELKQIFGAGQTASLMVAGYPVIEHILMELQDLRIQQCFVLACGNAHTIQASVGSTERWGMDMRVEVMNYSITKEQVLRQFRSLAEPNGLLVIEADRLRSHCIQDFLDAANRTEYDLLEASVNHEALGITLLKPTKADFIINAMPVHLTGVLSNALVGSRDFHRANFDLLAGKFKGLSPSVRMNPEFNRLQHWASKVHRKSTSVGSVMIAEGCRVSRNTSLNSVILNHNVFLEKNTSLSNTVVLPNSVISSTTPISNAIINHHKVFQLAA